MRKPMIHRVGKDDIRKRLASGRILPRDLLVLDRETLECMGSHSESAWLDLPGEGNSVEIVYKTNPNFITTLTDEILYITERVYNVREYGVYLTYESGIECDPRYEHYHKFLQGEGIKEEFEQGAGI